MTRSIHVIKSIKYGHWKISKDLLDMFTCTFSKISSIQTFDFSAPYTTIYNEKIKNLFKGNYSQRINIKEIASSASLIYQQFPHMEFIFHNSHVTIELAVFSRFVYNVIVFWVLNHGFFKELSHRFNIFFRRYQHLVEEYSVSSVQISLTMVSLLCLKMTLNAL